MTSVAVGSRPVRSRRRRRKNVASSAGGDGGSRNFASRARTNSSMKFREVSRDTIRESFGYPKGMLGASDNVNRANQEAGEVMFSRWLLVPRLERIKQALNIFFMLKGIHAGMAK